MCGAGAKPKKKHVLGSEAYPLEGVIKGGRSTLLLGPPGAGKTSILKMLGGRLNKQKSFSGGVSFFGIDTNKLKTPRWATFVGQEDIHQPSLTTLETLEFAWKCIRPSEGDTSRQDQLIELIGGREKFDQARKLSQATVDFFLRILMIYKCKDTIVGTQDGLMKGISGGERRRVTLGEMLVTGGKIWLCDEISTGLDSNSTSEICHFLVFAAKTLNTNCVVALLQPAPDVIELFEDILLIAEGQIIYHGPTNQAKDYFENMGFICPGRKDLGDFLQDIPTTAGLKFLSAESMKDPLVPKNVPQFVKKWRESSLFQAQHADVVAEHLKTDSGDMTKEMFMMLDDKPMPTWMESMNLVLGRSWELRKRNFAVVVGRVVQNVMMGLIFGSLFWQISDDEWYLRSMICFQMLGFMQAGTIGPINQMSKERAIFYKHRDAALYTGTHFAVAETLTLLPFNCFDALVFGNMLYWMCGMAPDLEAWAIFMALAIMYAVCMNQHAAAFAYALPNESASFTAAVMFILLYMVFAGAIATPDVIPGWLKWMYWINPQAWCYQALAINEFRSSKYDGVMVDGQRVCNYGGQQIPGRCGDFFLENRQFKTTDFYLWGAFVVTGIWILITFMIQCYALNSLKYETPKSTIDGDEEEEEAIDANPVSNRWFQGEAPEHRLLAVTDEVEELCIPCEATTFCFKDVTYSVPGRDDPNQRYNILNHVTGWAKPGKMCALMGASGAGKTTLMDVLAGRKTEGEFEGQICINGHIVVDGAVAQSQAAVAKFARSVGYVEQFGQHNETSTIIEALRFSAALRCSGGAGSDEQRAATRARFVDQVAKMLQLDIIADKLVMYTSIEENKRLTIGVEVVANPAVLFLDEPTSGLDARAAMIVMDSMKRIADTGRTVLATIHQPNIDIFSKFDGLLLLGKDGSKGGFTTYFNESIWEPSSSVAGDERFILENYFNDISLKKLPPNFNTATWMLNVIEEDRSQNWCYYYETHALHDANLDMADAMMSTKLGAGVPDSYQASTRTQFAEVLHRTTIQYWRSPSFSFSRLFVIFFVSGLVALIFQQQEYTNAAAVQSRCSVIAFMVMLGGIYNLYTMIPFFTSQRAVFYRERSAGMYSNAAYVFSTWVEIPYLALETLLGVNTMYWLIGFNQDGMFPWVYYNLCYFVYLCLQTFMGMVLSALMPNVMASQLIAALFINICSLFAGTAVPANKIPDYYKELYWFSPQKWAQEGVITTQ